MASKYRSYDELPLTLRVEDLMPILDIGRNTAYELIRCGKIRSIRIGKQLRIPKDALVEYLSDENR
ncbi:helix-turn-helix domain-containing protein [Dysosmobacter sp.]|uniref:helix-turn-helix domain-containing protein n=1 Tax=Dysosmobacter sp. TaxID=2591382 RepID=UPI002A9D2978|nr:helix-turn-helix domain-containing protein [Dysosmobacter sp.]MDY5509898.1 helix-turn-helix domain-containing protein [Dysosmobacter sp.]